MSKSGQKLRIALIVPHMFMHERLLPQVIFSPGELAISLADGLVEMGHEVTLYTPGHVKTKAANRTADLRYFERELAGRGDDYLDLLKKHPLTFITLARQVQSEIIAEALAAANKGEHDIVHVYTNEEDIALPFAQLCSKPVVFTHHDPYNFLVKYKSVMSKYSQLPWISFSDSQRSGMPEGTNWLATIYHGINEVKFAPVQNPSRAYFAYFGRIIEPKGVHLAVSAVQGYNRTADTPMKLKIAGKHYAGSEKHSYWDQRIAPVLGDEIEYCGFIGAHAEKRQFLGNAAALIVPSIFEEPFGMVAIESMACGTPVIALDSGALPELVSDGRSGFVAQKVFDDVTARLTEKPNLHSKNDVKQSIHKLNEVKTAHNLQIALQKWGEIDRNVVRSEFLARFTSLRMCEEYAETYLRCMDTR